MNCRGRLSKALVGSVFFVVAHVQAATVDFDNNPLNNYWVNPISSGGFVFTDITGEGSIGTDDSVDGLGPNNGTVHLMDWYNQAQYSPTQVRMQSAAGVTFDLTQFDFYSGYNDGTYIAGQLDVTGYDIGGNVIATATFLPSADFTNAWGTLLLGNAFTGLDHVVFAASGNMNRSGYDNIVVNESRIPVPPTLALVGLGLAGLGAVRRKKLAA